MNIIVIAQIVGLISFIILLCIKFYILIDIRTFRKSGRAAGLWLTIYLLFLVILRSLSLFKLADIQQLTIISGFSALIPLFGIIIQLILTKKMEKPTVLI